MTVRSKRGTRHGVRLLAAAGLTWLAAVAPASTVLRPDDEFERILRSVPPEATAPELEERALRLAELPGAAGLVLAASAAGRLSTAETALLACVTPRLGQPEVLACIRGDAARRSDASWRRAALGMLRWHATAADLRLFVRLVQDEQGGVSEMDPLVDLFQDGVAELVRRDVDALGELGWVTETAMPLRAALVHALGKAGRPEALAWLGEQLDDPGLCSEALQEIGRLAPSAPAQARAAMTTLVLPHLAATDARERSHAIRALATLGDPASVTALIDVLAGDDERDRRSAHAALRELTGRQLPPQVETWRAWHALELRWIAEEAPAALERLSSERESEVISAVRVLSEHTLDRDRLAARIAELLRTHPSAVVRGQACLALARLRSTVVRDALMAALADDEPAVRAHAQTALSSIQGSPPTSISAVRPRCRASRP